MERVIYTLVKRKSEILLSGEIFPEQIIIVDFFNIYCNIIKFNRYKTFSEETYKWCLHLILNKFKNNRVLIIAKDIFEVKKEYILDITNQNPNMTYIIVNDAYFLKSLNRERDDYTCILLQKYLLEFNCHDSYIVTNDKYKNYECLLKTVKPFEIIVIKGGLTTNFYFDQKLINKYNKKLEEGSFVKTINFSLV